MGKIKDWRQLGCLARKLTWVCQSDGCGTSKPFAKSIEAFSREWVLKVGKLIRYPTAISAKNNLGTTDSVQNTKSLIDYISCPKGSVKAVANQNKTNSKSLNISKLEAYEAIILCDCNLLCLTAAEVEQSPQLAMAMVEAISVRYRQAEHVPGLLGLGGSRSVCVASWSY